MQLNIKVKRAYLFTFSLSLVSFLLIVNDIKHLLWTLIFIYVFCYLLGLIVVDILKIDNSYNNIVLLIAIGISIILIFYNYWFLLNIKLPKILLISLFVILFIYGLYIFYRNFIQNIFQLKNYFINNATIEEIAIYVFIFILLFTVLFPLRKLYVAPLHDPVAISLLSKRIAQGGFTLNLVPNSMRFYPNGFAILVSVIGGIFNLDFAKEVLYATNIFNLMVGVSFYYLGKEIFKKDISGIACFFISSFLSYFPLSLYYIAGKNSQIFGYFISIFTAYFIIKIISNNEFNRKNIILLALLTAGSHYAHYNSTVFLFGIYTTVLFIIIIFRNEYKNKLSNLLLNYGITILCTVVLLIPNILIIKNSGGIKFDVTSRVIISNISVISIMHSFFVHIKLSSGILLKYIWWCGLFTIIPIIILKKYYWLKQYIFIFGILLWTIFTTSGFPEKLHLFFISSNFSTMLIFIPPVLFCTLFIYFYCFCTNEWFLEI